MQVDDFSKSGNATKGVNNQTIFNQITSGLLVWLFTPLNAPVLPLHFIRLLQSMVDPTTAASTEIDSFYIWRCRFFFSFIPNNLFISNARHVLGDALPWAIGASLVQKPEPCSSRVVSISGDGRFLFSGQELVTAVEQECDITHFIWNCIITATSEKAIY